MSTAPASPVGLQQFGPQTLPLGVFSTPNTHPRIGTRLGDQVVDLAALAHAVGHPDEAAFSEPTLNPFLELGQQAWHQARDWIKSLIDVDSLRADAARHSFPIDEVQMHLPIDVADYVDFYASEVHASNVSKLFRPDSPDLPANWKHLPIGYHGRAGTVVVSGTDVIRPSGQRRPGDDGVPGFGPSQRLDIECEVGFIVGRASRIGTPVSVDQAGSAIFGVVLLNDWSARDIQAWEYVPLGPFLGKSFATSISAWVVPLEALSAAEVPLGAQDPEPLAYLQSASAKTLDLNLTISLNGVPISSPTFKDIYWSPAQMLAHMTVNGASLRIGDLFGSGTVSGPDRSTWGSLLELSWNGTEPITLADGETRCFLQDGDVVTLTGWAPGRDGGQVTLGEVAGRITAAS